MTTAFPASGHWFKANLHTHSTQSDGHRTPEEVCADYRSRRYQVLSVTDHLRPLRSFGREGEGLLPVTSTGAFHTDDFITIPGAELHPARMANGELYHIVAVGLPEDFSSEIDDEGNYGIDIVRQAHAAGAWISLAHPHWNAVAESDAAAVMEWLHAIEVYNHGCEVEVSRGWGMHFADVLLQRGHRLQLNATDDAHIQTPGLGYLDAFGGWQMIRAESLTAESILAALKTGAYYSSTGPEIHEVLIEGGEIVVRCSPCVHVMVTGPGSHGRFERGASLIEVRIPEMETPYTRVTLIDANGKAAWTNPIWREDASDAAGIG